MTELDATTGALVKVLSKSKYEFSFADAIAVDGTHVWVANDVGDSLTEFRAERSRSPQSITITRWPRR